MASVRPVAVRCWLSARSRLTAGRDRLQEYRQRVDGLTPDDHIGPGARAKVLDGWAIALLALLDLNAWVIHRSTRGETPGWWPTDHLPWVREIEAAWPTIRAELNIYLASGSIPTTAEVNGLTATERAGLDAVPGSTGDWRVLLLQSFGKPVEENARHFPGTMRALENAPVAANVGFSALDPDAVISAHRDPNAGALRYQLPVKLPEPPGSCRITVEGEEVIWEEGSSVLFDLTREHSACNRGNGPRVLLMFETPMPLPFPASLLNSLTQRAYRALPSYRGITRRAARLSRRPIGDVA